MASGGAGGEVTAGPLRASVDAAGTLRVGWDEPDWFGPARLRGLDVADASVERDGDALVVDAGWVRSRVHSLAGESVLVVELAARAARDDVRHPDGFATPVVAWEFDPAARLERGAPAGLRAFGHQYTEFALPVVAGAGLDDWRLLLPFRPAVVLPLALLAPDGRTLLVAPLDAFHEQIVAVAPEAGTPVPALRAGWHGDLAHAPEGFTTRLAVIAAPGLRAGYATWARLLRASAGVAPPDRDADVLGTRVSYWTDNGSAYWYRSEPGLDVASSIVAAVDDLESRGVPIGAVQLDSWWYPHEVSRSLNAGEEVVPPTGMRSWEPRDDMLPDGIPDLRARLQNRPLVTHCRHLSASSVYVGEFACWVDGDRAHPQGPDLYERLLDQAVSWGVEVFEHDWLVECFLGVRALRENGRAAAWQEGVDRALAARNLRAQWCMASPADFAQATRLRNVTSIRTSGDHGYLVEPQVLWGWFLHNNAMARALGLWPYKDVFHASPEVPEREVEALLAALSAGPVGVGDRVGAADPALVRRTCRADGVLVRPDVPIAAIDRAAFDAPVWSGVPMVASAHTRHAAGQWSYVLACDVAFRPQPSRTRVAFAELGDDRPGAPEVAVLDWRTGAVEVLSAGGGYDVALDARGWDYRVLAPVLLGGIAVFGDATLYATAGDARVGDVVVDHDANEMRVTVLGANERVTLSGWSRVPIVARAWSPSGGSAQLAVAQSPDGRWQLAVDVPAAGWAHVHLRSHR